MQEFCFNSFHVRKTPLNLAKDIDVMALLEEVIKTALFSTI